MAVTSFLSGVRQLFDQNGSPLAGGKVYFYLPGTLTAATSYQNSDLQVPNPHPVILDANGRAGIWIDQNVDVEIRDSADVVIFTETAINPDVTLNTDSFNLITNGGFEANSTGDGITPDGWSITTHGATALDTTQTDSGTRALRFTSVGAGGGSAMSLEPMAVSPNSSIAVSFAVRTDNANIDPRVEVSWYDRNDTLLSTTVLYDPYNDVNLSNPSDWFTYSFTATPPASGRFARLNLVGGDPVNGESGIVWFDSVQVIQSLAGNGLVNRSGRIGQPIGTIINKITSATPTGCVPLIGETLGSNSSGANYLGDFYRELFFELWSDLIDTDSPMLDSGGSASSRGASAQADWDANKRLTLPDGRGCTFVMLDNQGGAAANVMTRAEAARSGAVSGAETHQLSVPEMPSHNHGVTGTFQLPTGTVLVDGAAVAVATNVSGQTFVAEGGGGTHNNTQPSLFGYWFVVY